jgi:hypothetical protein
MCKMLRANAVISNLPTQKISVLCAGRLFARARDSAAETPAVRTTEEEQGTLVFW